MIKQATLPILVSIVLLISSCGDNINKERNASDQPGHQSLEKRAESLEHLLSTFRTDVEAKPHEVPIWEQWLRSSGELPPDFDELQTNAFLPDLLSFQNGNPVERPEQWQDRKEEIRESLDEYMLGNWPPPPPKIAITYLESETEHHELYDVQKVQLCFAPSIKAVEYAQQNNGCSRGYFQDQHFKTALLNVKLFFPKRNGPLPAIITLGPREMNTSSSLDMSTEEMLKRGYMVCQFNRYDADFIAGVYVDFECNQLEWWAYAAGRCVDLLYSLENVDKSKIAIFGHSRSGKTAMLAAVMDERINAVINSHPGTGAGTYNLWRYSGEKFGGETLEVSTRQFPYWNNPRMRFFMGRENKLPFDSHFLAALVAPRPCMLGSGARDNVGEVWGDQQCYQAVKEVYKLLGVEQKLGFYVSPAGHTRTPHMMNEYHDWLDIQLGIKSGSYNEKLYYTYSFEDWKKITGEEIVADDFKEQEVNDILLLPNGDKIEAPEEWEAKTDDVLNKITWVIGDLPEYDKIQKVALENERTFREELSKAEIQIDDKLVAHLSYPAEKPAKIPVVIYLHAYLDANGYDWSRGYGWSTSVGERLARNGYLAVEFDQFGYGSRNGDCGIEFYAEHPEVSALGVMIQDVSKIIDAVSQLDWVDKDRIMVTGFSLGGMVGLYASVFDSRIKAVASTCGFASMRMDAHGKQTEGIMRYSHLRPTIPRMGLFLDNEKRIPYDFHEILGLIAPRPVLILAPELDQDWFHEDVVACYDEASKIYDLYGTKENITLLSPNDFNRYPPKYQELVIDWLSEITD